MPIGFNEVELITKYGHHMYQATQKTYPSVTTILDIVAYSQQLMNWANNLGFQGIRYSQALDQSAVRGTYVHETNQYYVDPNNAKLPRITDGLMEVEVRQRSNNFLYELRKAQGNWKTIFTETPFVSHTYEIGGTVDWFAEWYGKNTIFDYKTSSGLRDKHLLQVGGYYYGLTDNGLTIDQACIILCRRDRCIFYMIEEEELKRLGEIFFQIYDYYKSHEWVHQLVLDKSKTGT